MWQRMDLGGGKAEKLGFLKVEKLSIKSHLTVSIPSVSSPESELGVKVTRT